MSDTPRTDAETYDIEVSRGDCWLEQYPYPNGDGDNVSADFARQLERELAEAIAQRDELLDAIKRYLPFVPDMEPIGAAKHAEANLAAWNIRQVIAKLKGASHE